MKKHMISLLSIGQKRIQPFLTEHDKTCLNCSTNQKRDDLLEVFGAVRTVHAHVAGSTEPEGEHTLPRFEP